MTALTFPTAAKARVLKADNHDAALSPDLQSDHPAPTDPAPDLDELFTYSAWV